MQAYQTVPNDYLEIEKRKNSKDLSFIVILVADSHDAREYIIILRASIMYNLVSEFYCILLVVPKN